MVDLEGYVEICVLGIGGGLLDFDLSHIAGKILFNISYAIIYILRLTLGKHLNGAIPQVADKAGQLMTMRHPVSGKAKADALNATDKNYVFGNHF
jgi:hypothetical protein